MSDKLKTLANALHAAGHARFSDASYDAKRNAQCNLQGRTHYVDDATLRYFHSRITSSGNHYHGLIFGLIESVARDPDNKSRGFRYVLFDVFGTVIDRPGMHELVSSSDVARKRMYAALDALDVLAHYREALHSRIRMLDRETDALTTMLQGLGS
jgi:hypothetical protein